VTKLRALQIPTLVVTGQQDFIPVGIAEEIAKSLPNSSFTAIDACGHFAYLECPDAARKAIEGHLQRSEMKPR
jgi:proline iminopeptidase